MGLLRFARNDMVVLDCRAACHAFGSQLRLTAMTWLSWIAALPATPSARSFGSPQ